MHPDAQPAFDGTQLCRKPLPYGLVYYLEFPVSIHTTAVRESQEIEGRRLASPLKAFAISLGIPAKTNETGLLRMKRERKLLKSLVKL